MLEGCLHLWIHILGRYNAFSFKHREFLSFLVIQGWRDIPDLKIHQTWLETSVDHVHCHIYATWVLTWTVYSPTCLVFTEMQEEKPWPESSMRAIFEHLGRYWTFWYKPAGYTSCAPEEPKNSHPYSVRFMIDMQAFLFRLNTNDNM